MASSASERVALLITALEPLRAVHLRKLCQDGTLSAANALSLLTHQRLVELCRQWGLPCERRTKTETLDFFLKHTNKLRLVWDALERLLHEPELRSLAERQLGANCATLSMREVVEKLHKHDRLVMEGKAQAQGLDPRPPAHALVKGEPSDAHASGTQPDNPTQLDSAEAERGRARAATREEAEASPTPRKRRRKLSLGVDERGKGVADTGDGEREHEQAGASAGGGAKEKALELETGGLSVYGSRYEATELETLAAWESILPDERLMLLTHLSPADSNNYPTHRLAAAVCGAFGDVLTVRAVMDCLTTGGGGLTAASSVFEALCSLIGAQPGSPVLTGPSSNAGGSSSSTRVPVAGPRLQFSDAIVNGAVDAPLRRLGVDLDSLQRRCMQRALASQGTRLELLRRLVEDEDCKLCCVAQEQHSLMAAAVKRTKILHPTRHHGTTAPEFLSLHGMRAEHLVLAEPIDNAFQALLYAKDDSQPKRINLSMFGPDKVETPADYARGHVVISDNGVGMDVGRLTNWATDHFRPAERIIPEEDPNPDQDSWKDPNPHPPGTAEHQAFEDRRELMEEYFCDGRLAKRGTGSKAAGFFLGEDLIMISKMKGKGVCELRLSTSEFDQKEAAGKPWYENEVVERPAGSWVGSFVESPRLSACKPLLQHIRSMEAKYDHFTIFIISSLIPHKAMHLMGDLDEAQAQARVKMADPFPAWLPHEFVTLCRQLRHMYFFMLSLGEQPYAGGPVELNAEFVRFKRSNGQEVHREIESGASSGLMSYGDVIKVRLWYLPPSHVDTLHKKRVDWPLEQQLEVFYKGRLMPYEFLPSVLDVLGIPTIDDPAVADQLKRVRGAAFLGSNKAVHNTKWNLNPPLATSLRKGAHLGTSRSSKTTLLNWLDSCHAEYDKKVVLSHPFIRGALPHGLEGPLFKQMMFGKTKYAVGMKVVVKVSRHASRQVPITIVGTIEAFKRKSDGAAPGVAAPGVADASTPSKTRRRSGAQEGAGSSRLPASSSTGPSDEGEAACTMYLLREPQSLFACPEGEGRPPPRWEVSSRNLQENEKPEEWIAKEVAKVPRTLALKDGTYWPFFDLVCHEPVRDSAESITRLELKNARGAKVAATWETCLPGGSTRCTPSVTRRVYLEQAPPTNDGLGQELSHLKKLMPLEKGMGFSFPGFVVHKPGQYWVQYSLEEPRLPWCDQFPQPTCLIGFTALVGPPKAFDLDFLTLQHLPAPGSTAPADTLPAVRLGEPFEAAVSFFDKEQVPDDDAYKSRNACTGFDPAGLSIRVSMGPEDRLCAVHAHLVGAASSSGKGQPLHAVLQLSRAKANLPAKIPPGGTVQTVVFTLEGHDHKFSPFRQRLLLLPGHAVPPTSNTGDNDGGASDFVGLGDMNQVVNRETTLRFKVRFHDSEGNETQFFPPHTRVRLLVTRQRVGPAGAGTQPEVLLERSAVFGADGTLAAILSSSLTSTTSCQGDLFLDEEGDIAVHGLRMNLEFSRHDAGEGDDSEEEGDEVPSSTPAADRFQAVDIRVSLDVPTAGGASCQPAEQAPSGLPGSEQTQEPNYATISKVKTIQVLPSSRPSRVRLCFQDGMTWRESTATSIAADDGSASASASMTEYEFTRIPAGQSLPELAVRVESETGEKLLGPVSDGEAHEGVAYMPGPPAGRKITYKVVGVGSKYTSTAVFRTDGILPEFKLPTKAGRHVIEFKHRIRVVAVVEAGPHAKWSIISLPEQTPQKKMKKPQGTPHSGTGADAVASNGPPSLVLGQPLSRSRLAFVPLDEYNNFVPIQDAPTLRVVPRRAGEEEQEAVTFLAEALRTVAELMDVDDEEETQQVDAPEGGGHTRHPEQVRPVDTLPWGYLRRVIGGQGQDSGYFCFRSDAESYLYRQEPLQSSSSSSASSSGSSSGSSPSADFALQISSSGGARVTSRVDVEISNPVAESNSFILDHGMPDSHLMSWQEISRAWGEVRVGPLPGGYSVRAFDPRIRHLCLEARSSGLQLRVRDLPLTPAMPVQPTEPRETRSRRRLVMGQQGADSRAVLVPTPVPLAADRPGVFSATMDTDGRYLFPTLFAVRVMDGPREGPQGMDSESMLVTADMEGSGVSPPEAAALGPFAWRPNPNLVRKVDLHMELPAHLTFVAGSPVPRFEISLEGEDGVTRDATLVDAPALRVILTRPGVRDSEIPLKPQAQAAPTDKAYFTAASQLTAVGGYQVAATWTNDRLPDRRTDVTGSCVFDVIPGPAFKLVAPSWQPGSFDNVGRTKLFDKLEVSCVDRYDNRVVAYGRTLELSVFPKVSQPGGDAQAPEYATLANGNPRSEMREGVATIHEQHLRDGVGRIDGDYVLQVAPVSNVEGLVPLRLDFSFTNLHGLSERLANVNRRILVQHDIMWQHLKAYEEAAKEAQVARTNHKAARRRCLELMTYASLILHEPCGTLPEHGDDAHRFLQELQERLETAQHGVEDEMGRLERDLDNRQPRHGLTHEQQQQVDNARASGHAYGTLTMLAAVEDAGDAKLLSRLLGDNAKTVVLKDGAPLNVLQMLKDVGLGVIAITEAPKAGSLRLPHEGMPLTQFSGNPRFGTSVVKLNSNIQDDSASAGMMKNVVHSLVGEVVILDRAEDAEAYVEGVLAAQRQGTNVPSRVLPKIISCDGRYLRSSNGTKQPTGSLQEELRRNLPPCFGAPSRENCRRLRDFQARARDIRTILQDLLDYQKQLSLTSTQLQAVQPLAQERLEKINAETRKLAALEAERQEAEEEQNRILGRVGAAACATHLLREPLLMSACPEGIADPEGVVRSTHLREVSSRCLQDNPHEDFVCWIEEELADIPKALTPMEGFAWPTSTLVCHELVPDPAKSITRLALTNLKGKLVPAFESRTWKQDNTTNCNPSVTRRVFFQESITDENGAMVQPERELAFLAMTATSSPSRNYFEFPGFNVLKPGSYRIEYSLQEPDFTWSKEFPRPIHEVQFTAVRSGQTQDSDYAMISKFKAMQGVPSSHPSRVCLCFQDGGVWSFVPAVGGAGMGTSACTTEYELQHIPAGQSLPKLAVRVESEMGEKLLGPELKGDAEDVAVPGPAPGQEFSYKIMGGGSQYMTTATFHRHGIISGLHLPTKAGRHVIEFKVKSMQRLASSAGGQAGSGSGRGADQVVEFKHRIRVVAVVEAGPLARWSIMTRTDSTQQAETGADAVPRDSPPSLILGQPLSRSRLAFVPLDAFGNHVAVQDAPTLRVVPRRAGEEGQEAVTFLAEALRTVAEPMDFNGGDTAKQVGAPGRPMQVPADEEMEPVDTLPGEYLRRVIGGQGQDSGYFCFRSDAEAYLYRQEPLSSPPSPSTAKSSLGPSPSKQYALEISSVGESQITSRMDVEISNPTAGSKCFILLHDMPDRYLMPWQEISGAWAEVRECLPGGHSVRVIDEHIQRLCFEALSTGLQLWRKNRPQHYGPPTRLRPRDAKNQELQAGTQEGAGSEDMPATGPLLPAGGRPGIIVAPMGQDGTYMFPSFFTVQPDATGPSTQGDDASVVVRAEVEEPADVSPEDKILRFIWRPNPSLVKELVIHMAAASASERSALVAGSCISPRFEVTLTGQDGVTRVASLADAPALRVTLNFPTRCPAGHIRLRPQDGAPTEGACFTPPVELTAAGAYQVVATWTDDRIPDQHTDVTALCAFEVRPGRSVRLVARNWQPRLCDNLARTRLFDVLEVECVDSYGNRVLEYSGTLELSVFPRDAQPGGNAQAPEYATLAHDNPRFEMRDGVATIPAQHLRDGVGQVDGDYVLQVSPVPNVEGLEPLPLDFYFINMHGLSDRVQGLKREVEERQDEWLRRIQEYEAGVRIHEAYKAVQESCSQMVAEASRRIPVLKLLPGHGEPASVEALEPVVNMLLDMRNGVEGEAGQLEDDLRTRNLLVRDGLTENQRRVVKAARRGGLAHGTLPMLTVVQDGEDARLMSCMTRDSTRTVVLANMPAAAERNRLLHRLMNAGLNVIAIDEVSPCGNDPLPHEDLPVAAVPGNAAGQAFGRNGNPRYGAAMVEVNSDHFQDALSAIDKMVDVVHALVGKLVVLNEADDATSYVREMVAAWRQHNRRPVLPKVVSRDGAYLRESSGALMSAESLQKLWRNVRLRFRAPSPQHCHRLRALQANISGINDVLLDLRPGLARLIEARRQRQEVQPVHVLQEARDEAKRRLDECRAELQRAEQQERAALAASFGARAAHAAPAGPAQLGDSDSDG
eukprot:jgi/Mesvir1/18185/Mv09472-RA.1